MHRKELNRLNSLDFLLLALVKYGLATSYDLMKQAGIPVSVTSPTLRGLKGIELLTSETRTTGARSSEQYSITKKGDEELRACSKSDHTRDFRGLSRYCSETVHRTLFLTWLFSEQASGQKHVLWASGELRFRSSKSEQDAEEIKEQIGRLPSSKQGQPNDVALFVAMTYQWMKAVSDAALLKVQAQALEEVAATFLKMSPAPSLAQSAKTNAIPESI